MRKRIALPKGGGHFCEIGDLGLLEQNLFRKTGLIFVKWIFVKPYRLDRAPSPRMMALEADPRTNTVH